MNLYRNTLCAVASVVFTLAMVGFSTSAVAVSPIASAAHAAVTSAL